jgi:hypothetical protein
MRIWCILVFLLSPSPLLLTQGSSADTMEPLTTGTPQIEYDISVLYLYLCNRHILFVTILTVFTICLVAHSTSVADLDSLIPDPDLKNL